MEIDIVLHRSTSVKYSEPHCVDNREVTFDLGSVIICFDRVDNEKMRLGSCKLYVVSGNSHIRKYSCYFLFFITNFVGPMIRSIFAGF